MELKDRLRQARKNAGLTQSELADRVGVKQSSISEIERGLTRSSSHLIKIAQVLDVNPVWLSEGDDHPASPSSLKARLDELVQGADAELLGEIDSWEDGEELAPDDVEIPYFAEVEFAGGNGMTEVVEVADRRLRFSRSTLRAAGVDAKSAACARLRGRSMERLILDGAAIGFDQHDTSIIDGEIYAFNHGGLLRVKYLDRLPGGGVRIRSENRDEYPDEVMSGEQFAQEVQMLGRVFWWSTVRRSPRKTR